VIMTSHGRGGIVRSALGSVTDRMLGGTAPVVVVRPVE
jgi:nucleotide-binding universal stress UspA family protein